MIHERGKFMTQESENCVVEYWRSRALAAEVEVRDLLKEQQRLQYLVEELTNRLAVSVNGKTVKV